jgi:hypothetical protein
MSYLPLKLSRPGTKVQQQKISNSLWCPPVQIHLLVRPVVLILIRDQQQ